MTSPSLTPLKPRVPSLKSIMVDEHKCEIAEETSQSLLPPLPPNPTFCQKLRRNFRKWAQISERNPRCAHYYRSSKEVLELREMHAKSKSFVIHPFSVFRLYYEFYMAFVFLFCLIYMPFDAAFDRHQPFGWDYAFRIMSIVASALCTVDIMMRFNTGRVTEKEKKVNMGRKAIIKSYVLSFHFFADFMSSLPDASIYTRSEGVARIIDTFAMLKIFRIKTMFDYFLRMAEYFNIHNTGFFEITRLVLLILLTLHWVACTCYLVPTIRMSTTGSYSRNSWVVARHIWFQTNIGVKYIKSLFRAGGYILGIHFESHDAFLLEEVFMSCFLYSLGKLFTWTLIVILVQKLLTIRSFETKYYEIIEQVKAFGNRNHLSPQIMDKLLLYYDYKYYKTYFKENKITALLSESLKKEVNADALKKLTETVDMFVEMDEDRLLNILSHLHAEIYLPNDIIINAGSIADGMYFIASGTVAVLTPSGKEVCHLSDGQFFGEIGLVLKDQRRTANVIALEICEVYKLTKRGFQICFRDLKELKKSMETEAYAKMQQTQEYEDLFIVASREVGATE